MGEQETGKPNSTQGTHLMPSAFSSFPSPAFRLPIVATAVRRGRGDRQPWQVQSIKIDPYPDRICLLDTVTATTTTRM